jgi:hypothetical protein
MVDFGMSDSLSVHFSSNERPRRIINRGGPEDEVRPVQPPLGVSRTTAEKAALFRRSSSRKDATLLHAKVRWSLQMVAFSSPADVDAYYVRHGILRLRVLQRRRDKLDPVTAELVSDWLARYDGPPTHRASLPAPRTQPERQRRTA